MASLVATVTSSAADLNGLKFTVDLVDAAAPAVVIASNAFTFAPLTSPQDVKTAVRQWMESCYRHQQWVTAAKQQVGVGDHIGLTV